MTGKDLQALVQLLNRVPMTVAEQLWCQRFIAELQELVNQKQQKEGGKQ